MIGHFATTGANGPELVALVVKAISMLYHLANLWCLVLIGNLSYDVYSKPLIT